MNIYLTAKWHYNTTVKGDKTSDPKTKIASGLNIY